MTEDDSRTGDHACPHCGSGRASLRFDEDGIRVVRCRRCGLVYTANPPREDALYERYFEGAAADARQYRAGSPSAPLAALHAINRQRIAAVRAVMPGGRLLDVGCGQGYFLKTAQQRGYAVQGIDISQLAAAYARDRLQVPADSRTLEGLAAAGERFDIITMWHVLEHFADPGASLALVRTLLNDGGRCAIEVPNLNSLKFLAARRKWQGGNHPRYHRTFFTARTLRLVLAAAGFTSIRRLPLTYDIPGRDPLYRGLKSALNRVGLDSFLTFVAGR